MIEDKHIDQLYKATYKKLSVVNRNYFLIQMSAALLQWLFIWAVLFLGLVITDFLFDASPQVRIGFWGGVGLVGAYFLFWRIGPALWSAFWPGETHLYRISRRIGQKNQDIQDALINFLQIYREKGTVSDNAFKTLSLKQLYQKFSDTNFYHILSLKPLQRPCMNLFGSAGVLLICGLIFPGGFRQAVSKMLHPAAVFKKPFPVRLINFSDTLTVLKNDTVRLQGSYEGITPRKLWLVIQNNASQQHDAALEKLEVALSGGRNFSYEIVNIKQHFAYWFEAGVDMAAFQGRLASSDTGVVLIRERPYIRELQLKLTYPSYTGLEPVLLNPNQGEITALVGTRVTLEVQANKNLSHARLQFEDSLNIPLRVTEKRARGTFVVQADGQYQVMLRDDDRIANYRPVKYAVFAVPDEMPFVEITQPGQDLDLGENLQLDMLINLRDDFGFSKLLLKGYHIHAGSGGDTSAFTIPLPMKKVDKNRAISKYHWDLRPFYLISDDYIEYFAEVQDNDRIQGPKSARSKTFVLRLPSLFEILDETHTLLAEQLDKTREMETETQKLKEKLAEINLEMKREKELIWERKQEIQEQLHKQQESLEKLENVRKEIEKLAKNLDQQNVLSPETLEKYFELQKMFQEAASPELLEKMKQLQEMLQKGELDSLKESMKQFQMSVEQFEQQIERMHELLKQVQLEQKMDELVKFAEKLAEDQGRMNQEMKQNPADSVKQKQRVNKADNLKKNTRMFQELLEAARKTFLAAPKELRKQLQAAEKYMQDRQLEQQLQEMQKAIQEGNSKQAQQMGKALKQQFDMLQSMVQKARQEMMQAQKQEILQAMHKILKDLLRASYKQEALAEAAAASNMASRSITDIAHQQSQIQENTRLIVKEMIALSGKTFFLSPQIHRSMAEVDRDMQISLVNLENRNPSSASLMQKNAMANLNRAIILLQQSMEKLTQSNSASGFQQMMQQLQQMAGQQGELNQKTMNLFPQPGQGKQGRLKLNPAEMARLAAEQEMIRNTLEKMSQKMGGAERKDVLGRLGSLGEEMQKVIDDLKKEKLDARILKRQQRILSRMLDAQKSVREKAYSKKRQAERGLKSLEKSPSALKEALFKQEDKLRKEMLDALKEGYSSEYKKFIKLYYDELFRRLHLKE